MSEAEELERTLLTVRDWLRYAVSRFTEAGLAYGHGTASALDEAAYLILHTLHLPSISSSLGSMRGSRSTSGGRWAQSSPSASPRVSRLPT